jgi:hypothetical protein
VDYEMVCRALEGLAFVADGRVREGMRRLDAAVTAALAGEVENVRAVEVICCHLIDACQRVRDLERAGEWCLRVEEIAERYGDTEMFATCRTHYADLRLWRGEWREAEQTLTAACRDLGGVPRKVAEGWCGWRAASSAGALDQAERCSGAEAHRLSLLVRAALKLDRGDARSAEGARSGSCAGLGTQIVERCRSRAARARQRGLGDLSAARRAVEELEDTAADVGTARFVPQLCSRESVLTRHCRRQRGRRSRTVDLFVECGAHERPRGRVRAGRRPAGARSW